MLRDVIRLLIAAFGLAGMPFIVNAQLHYKAGAGGLLYKIVDKHSGEEIKEGDFVSLNLIVKTERDSVLFDSYKNGRPVVLIMSKPHYRGDIYAGIQWLTAGDSAIFKANVDSLRQQGSKSDKLSGKYITYYVRVKHVIFKRKLTEEEFKKQTSDYIRSLPAKL